MLKLSLKQTIQFWNFEVTPKPFAAKVGENGKIFGSVSNVQVTEAVVAAGFEVERKNIKLIGDVIKTVGKYKANVQLHKEISVEIEFEVVEG